MMNYIGPEIGAKSVIALATLKSLQSLALSHEDFKFADMYHMMKVIDPSSKSHTLKIWLFFLQNESDPKPSTSLKILRLDASFSASTAFSASSVLNAFKYVPVFLPSVERISILWNSLIIPTGVDLDQLEVIGAKVREFEIANAEEMDAIARVMPNLEKLSLEWPKIGAKFESGLASLVECYVMKPSFTLDFALLAGILLHCPRLKKLHFQGHQISNASDERIKVIFRDERSFPKEISELAVLSDKHGKGRVPLTLASVKVIIDACPSLTRLGSIHTWDIDFDSDEVQRVLETGLVSDSSRKWFRPVLVQRYHHHLPWKGFDGEIWAGGSR